MLEETRIARVIERLGTRVRLATEEESFEQVELLDRLEAIEGEGYDEEKLAASGIRDVAKDVHQIQAPPRYLQGDVYEERKGETSRVDAFRAGALHELRVFIAPEDEKRPGVRAPFPEDELPPGESLLTVVVTAQDLLEEPESRELVLPEHGRSETLSFWLRAPLDERLVEARIIVLHEGRILQTAMLRGHVCTDPEGIRESEAIRVDTEAVVRSLDGLTGAMRFDAAFVLNHDGSGVEKLTTVVEEAVDVRTPQGLASHFDDIAQWLEDAVTEENGGQALRDDKTRHLLVFLAKRGREMYEGLMDIAQGSSIASWERIQILSADAEAFFPVEFVYERESPTDQAQVCANAEQALTTGTCGDCTSVNDPSIVCPLGFWCMTKVIERQLHDADLELPKDFRFSAPRESHSFLRPLDKVLLAASERNDKGVPGTMAGVEKALEAATGKPPIQARTWSEWIDAVRDESPPLLMVLPHTLKSSFQEWVLEIETSEQLARGQITEMHVGAGDPVVVLLGCETGEAKVPLAEFPATFRRRRAGVVVATLTKVLGRHAGPVAIGLVSALAEHARNGPIPFGVAMRDVRRQLLKDGEPTVLVVTAYGDAGWLLFEKGG
jgi:hypothetical protein